MKIGYVLKKFPRLSETFILNEMLALEKLGIELVIFSLRQPDEEPRHASVNRLKASIHTIRPLAPRGIFLHLDELSRNSDPSARAVLQHYIDRLDLRDPWRLEALAFSVPLANLARELEIEHFHAHFATGATAAAAETARLTNRTYSFTMHAKDIYRDSVCFATLGRRMREAAFAVTVCEANARWLASQLSPVDLLNLRVLYNGIDLDEWNYHEAARSPLLVAIGRLIQKKGFEDFLRACAILRAESRQFEASLIGNGEQASELKELRARLGLETQVEMPGELTQSQVRERLARASLLVAPCIRAADGNQDALPTVILEAMSLGTPCVATPIAGIPEIIRTKDEGWLVPPSAPAELARVMAHALENPEHAARKGKMARSRIESCFDLQTNVRHLADWFENAIHGYSNLSEKELVREALA